MYSYLILYLKTLLKIFFMLILLFVQSLIFHLTQRSEIIIKLFKKLFNTVATIMVFLVSEYILF